MSNRIKTFGQFKIKKDGIETVGNCKYEWISREDIMQKKRKPMQSGGVSGSPVSQQTHRVQVLRA